MSIRRGLSLIELLVVIAIIGILVGLTVPAVQSARNRAVEMQCQNNIRQIHLAVTDYVHIYKKLPPPSAEGLVGGWTIEALLFLEQKAMRDQTVPGTPIAKAPDFLLGPPRIMRCPMRFDEPKPGVMAAAHYILIPAAKRKTFTISDTPLDLNIPWASGPESPDAPKKNGPHSGGFFRYGHLGVGFVPPQ